MHYYIRYINEKLKTNRYGNARISLFSLRGHRLQLAPDKDFLDIVRSFVSCPAYFASSVVNFTALHIHAKRSHSGISLDL